MGRVFKIIGLFFLPIFYYGCLNNNRNSFKVEDVNIEINELLKEELSQILNRDQGFRILSGGGISEEKKKEWYKILELDQDYFEANENRLFEENDSLNLVRIERIIKRYGYPGKSLVGEPENESAWYVIQHSNKIETYFPIIKEAGVKGELPMTKVAMMEDRLLMSQGKEQLYGSQGKGIFIVENPTKAEDMIHIIWPIKNPEKVNELRKSVGFETTVQENARRMRIEYKVYTLEEVSRMKKTD
jgi:hypothetical protein